MPAIDATRLPTTGPSQRNDNASAVPPPPPPRRWPLTLTTRAQARIAAITHADARRFSISTLYCSQKKKPESRWSKATAFTFVLLFSAISAHSAVSSFGQWLRAIRFEASPMDRLPPLAAPEVRRQASRPPEELRWRHQS